MDRMMDISSSGRGNADFEPLVVSPREACRLLSIGTTRLY
jgi:hypothetical protein